MSSPLESNRAAASFDDRLRRTGQRLDGLEQPRGAFLLGKVRRHIEWARTEGIAKLIEEDDLDPRARVRKAVARRRWRRSHPNAGRHTRPVFVVGLQRSGTNMVTRGFDEAPEFEVINENNRRAFSRYQLRDEDVAKVVRRSRHAYVLFKPLCDSHRIVGLLDKHSTELAPAIALWVFRDPRGRARSAVAKFGDNDKTVLEAINAGLGHDLWQIQELSADVLATLASFDVSRLSESSASALFWWARNSLYFDLGFPDREDVLLVHYNDFVADPRPVMTHICSRLGLDPREQLYAHADSRALGAASGFEIDPRVGELCDALYTRLIEQSRSSRPA